MQQNTLQSLKTVIAVCINGVEENIKELQYYAKEFYQKADKDTQDGEFYFKQLNKVRNEILYFKKKRKKLVALQKEIKLELADTATNNLVDSFLNTMKKYEVTDIGYVEGYALGDVPNTPQNLWSDKIV